MPKTIRYGLFALAIVFLSASCGTTQITLGEPFQLKLGEKAKLKGDKSVKVVFTELVSDSRCPKNTNCIWAGEAKIAIGINDKATEFTLPGLSEQAVSHTEGDYTYQVNKLEPYPEMKEEGEEAKEADIMVEMVVNKN